jgi:hypothetical protein
MGGAEIAVGELVLWLGIPLSKFHDWRHRYGDPSAAPGFPDLS